MDEIHNQYVRVVSPQIFNDLLDTRAEVDFSNRLNSNNMSLKKIYRQNLQEYFQSETIDSMLQNENWFEEILWHVV